MNSEARDRFLRMIVPALLIGVGYFMLFNKHDELTAAQESLAAAQAAAVNEADVQIARFEANETAAELSKLQREKQAADDRWTRLKSFSETSPARRTSALRQLTRLLRDRGLYLFEEAPAGNGGQLPASFDDVLARLGKTAAGPASSRLWQVRFYGRYSDVVDALWSLGESDVELVPVGLQMSEARTETPWRVWTLLLWN